MSKLQTAIEKYLDTRLDYDEKKDASNLADRVHKAAKAQLVEAMLEQQQTGMKLDNGLAFHLSNQFSIKVNQGNEEDVKDWLHGFYGDLEEFIVQKVNKSRVEERIKSDIEAEKLDEFEVPDFFDLKTRPDVSCRGWKTYAEERKSK